VGSACGTHGRREKSVRKVGRPEGKRPLRRPKYRWEDGIRMVVRKTGWEDVE
jgi:hypothetical protein